MAITFSNMEAIIRRTVLKDSNVSRWTKAQLLDAVGWALDIFAIHTAIPSSITWTVDSTQPTTYTMPGNIFSDPMTTALLRYKLVSEDRYEMLPGIRYTVGTSWLGIVPDETTVPRGWWVWPDTTLNLRFKPERNSELTMLYFAKYTRPVDDNSVMEIPSWAEGPVAILAGSFCVTAESTATSYLRQFGTKPDTGTPEQNPLQRQATYLYDLYLRIVQQYPAQERETYWPKAKSLR
jgi:hypothetical protein